MEHCGNTVSSTIPIAISEVLLANRFINRKNVVLSGFRVGYSLVSIN